MPGDTLDLMQLPANAKMGATECIGCMIDGMGKDGSLDWTRTSDPLINSQLLYQLSYQGT